MLMPCVYAYSPDRAFKWPDAVELLVQAPDESIEPPEDRILAIAAGLEGT